MSSYFNDDDDDIENKINDSDDESVSSSQNIEDEEYEEEDNTSLHEGGGGEEAAEIDVEIEDEEEDNDEDEEDNDEEEYNDENDDGELDEKNYEEGDSKTKKIKTIPTKNIYKKPIDLIDDDEEDDDDNGEQYLQKFDQSINDNYILNFHPESVSQNYNEILSMTNVVRNNDGIVIDKLHRTIPYLTKYEKARILGQRAKQINSGAYPFVKVPENVIDGYIIAEMELKQKIKIKGVKINTIGVAHKVFL